MLEFGVGFDGPLAVRYPRGQAYRGLSEFDAPVEYGKAEMLFEEIGHRSSCPGKHGQHRRACEGKAEGQRIFLYSGECPVCKAPGHGY